VADAPGHEQYTRNMATGASASDFGVILVDAANGVTAQTRRHACILSLLGVRDVALVVNKMDAVGYSEAVFDAIALEFGRFAAGLSFRSVEAVPVSALTGENVVAGSEKMAWSAASPLLTQLENAPGPGSEPGAPFRMPVQWVSRPNDGFRGYAGTIVSGAIAVGDEIVAYPSGRRATLARIVTYDGDLKEAVAGDAVTLALDRELDIARGDVLACAQDAPEISDQIAAHVVWMGEDPMLPGRTYVMQCGAQTATATIGALKHRISIDTLEEKPARKLDINEFGFCNIGLSQPIVFDPYPVSRDMGGFILIDRLSNATVAAGMISFGLRRATNIQWQALSIDKQARADLKHQRPCVLWFTGLSGAGKSTIADLVDKKLHHRGRHTYVLDGDNVRHGLNKDLGFTDADRVENIRRVAETARLFVDAGMIAIVSFISPFRSERAMARELVGEGEFLEIHVDTALAACERRDPKGLYAKARAGLIRNFTGIDSAYEAPETPELRLDTERFDAEELADEVIAELVRRRLI
jgi:bifunctional enzyme CysN/CysC